MMDILVLVKWLVIFGAGSTFLVESAFPLVVTSSGPVVLPPPTKKSGEYLSGTFAAKDVGKIAVLPSRSDAAPAALPLTEMALM